MKHSHILAAVCCTAALLGVLCTAGAAASADTPAPEEDGVFIPPDVEAGIGYAAEPDGYITLDGEIGTSYLIGDCGWKIISAEEATEAFAVP